MNRFLLVLALVGACACPSLAQCGQGQAVRVPSPAVSAARRLSLPGRSPALLRIYDADSGDGCEPVETNNNTLGAGLTGACLVWLVAVSTGSVIIGLFKQGASYVD